MTIQYDVFLCHNSRDKPEVKEIEQQLQAQGIRTFLDVSEILGGDSWSIKIVEAISESKTGVVFLGSNDLGLYQKKEIKEFRGKRFRTNFKVIPVLLKDAPPPENLNLPSDHRWLIDELHCVDLRSGKDPQALEKLIKAIQNVVDTNSQQQPVIIPPKPIPDPLPSEKGVDYTRLRDLLKAGNWKEADKETLAVMLKAAGKQPQDYLYSDDIKKIPCTDLRTIDQLWVEYSNGRFGFSVQKRIWESVGKDYCLFGDRVGWRKGMFFNNYWLYDYDCLTFSLEAPKGHLPGHGIELRPIFRVFKFARVRRWGVEWVMLRESLGNLFSRVETCKM